MDDNDDDFNDDAAGVIGDTTNLQINFTNGKFADHSKLIGYQIAENVIVVYDQDGTSHIYPIHTIQNITVNPK